MPHYASSRSRWQIFVAHCCCCRFCRFRDTVAQHTATCTYVYTYIHKQWTTAVHSGVGLAVASFQPFTCAMSIKHLRRVSRRLHRDMPRPPAHWNAPLFVATALRVLCRNVPMCPCGHVAFIPVFGFTQLMTQWSDASAAKLIGKTHTLRMLNGRHSSDFCSLFAVSANRNRFGNTYM